MLITKLLWLNNLDKFFLLFKILKSLKTNINTKNIYKSNTV